MTQRRVDAAPLGAILPGRGRVIHPRLRQPLSLYKWLFGFVVVGVLLTAPVAVLIQHGSANFLPNVISQIAALWSLITAYPVLAAFVVLALVALFALSLRADAENAADAQAAIAQTAAAAGGEAGKTAGADVVIAMIPQVQEAAAGGGYDGGYDGGYSGATDAVIEQTPAMAEAVAKRLQQDIEADIRTGIEIAVEAGRHARREAPPLPPGVVTTVGLPRPRTLFGRAPQLDALLQALATGGAVNVCAVEGLPGIGKTAVAAETVAQAVERGVFATAIWLSCEGKHGAVGLDSIWTDVATLLGETEITQLPDATRQRAALHAALADPMRARLLLALDNVEPDLPTGYADMLAQTLAGPQVALLLTARQALDSSLVRAFPLGVLASDAAQAFFRSQLQLRFPDRPTSDEAQALPAIITELDGLALAIQLTADYASAQRRPLPALLTQLRAEGVSSGPLAKLTASIDRSWAVLSPTQRLLFAGLSLLDGSSFPRAAALAVAAEAVEQSAAQATSAAAPAETSGDALDALVGLSLVEPLTDDRMRLHPLLREYAAKRLGEAPAATQNALGAAAFAYWLAFAEEHPGYDGMDALEEEAAGLMLALTWAHDHQRHADILALAHALNRFWFVRGRVAEARLARPWAVTAAKATGNRSELRWAYHELAVLASQTGDLAGARAGFAEALRLATALGDKRAMCGEIYSLAQLAERLEEKERGYNEALALAHELRDPAPHARGVDRSLTVGAES